MTGFGEMRMLSIFGQDSVARKEAAERNPDPPVVAVRGMLFPPAPCAALSRKHPVMFATAKMFVLATAAAISMPALAGAASFVIETPITVGQNYSFGTVIAPGDDIEYRFTVLSDLWINGFSVSGTGTNAEDDVRDIRFGLTNPPTELFSSVSSVDETAAGFGFLDGGTWSMGEMFSVFFSDGIDNEVGLTLSFETQDVAAVPLPAAGLLLAPVLLAGAAAALRRRKMARTSV